MLFEEIFKIFENFCLKINISVNSLIKGHKKRAANHEYMTQERVINSHMMIDFCVKAWMIQIDVT